ncbi:hypothetical protein GEV43_21350 [Actinomadura sp. J1-007]|nr:hypothetical protein [Actinomadura sp. J1-007]
MSMPFEPFNQILDLIEFEKLGEVEALARLDIPKALSPRLIHEGLAVWVRQAVRRFRDGLATDMAVVEAHDLTAVRPWVHQIPAADPHSRTYELCVWGRGYTYRTASGLTRELRVPVIGHADGTRRSDAERAVMAYVVAVGGLVDTPVFDKDKGRFLSGVPFPVLPATATVPGARTPEHVRVVEVGLADGESVPLFQGSVEAASAYFAKHGRTAIRDLFRSTDLRPGYDCLDCKARTDCNRLPTFAGLLGIRDRSRARRVFTATNGRYHAECAAKEYFRSLRLPVDAAKENTPAVRQGKAVHAWLERLHNRSPRRPCTEADMPEDPDSWSAGGWHLQGAEARNAAAMLAHHPDICPFIGLAPDAPAYTERVIAADDPRSNTLVIAHADLVYLRNGSWRYRELKTTSSSRIHDGESLLNRYPQAALAVLLFEAGAIPLGPLSAVEVEILTPHGADLRILDPNSAPTREAARRKVNALASAWHADVGHLANPGPACQGCSYLRWCPSAKADANEVASA